MSKPKRPKSYIEIKCVDSTYYAIDLDDCNKKSLLKTKLKIAKYLKYWEHKPVGGGS